MATQTYNNERPHVKTQTYNNERPHVKACAKGGSKLSIDSWGLPHAVCEYAWSQG